MATEVQDPPVGEDVIGPPTLQVPLADEASAGPPTIQVQIGDEHVKTRELLDEFLRSLHQGAPLSLESLYARWPERKEGDPEFTQALLQDFQYRKRHGEPVEPEDYARRFPAHAERWRNLVDALSGDATPTQVFDTPGGTDPSASGAHASSAASARPRSGHDVPSRARSGAELHSKPRSGSHLRGSAMGPANLVRLPQLNEVLFDFRFKLELGRGAYARVYLAEQTSLADRPVVAKVSEIRGDEHIKLAQLQHTHIVPILSVFEDPDLGLRVVCMPYFGGANLALILRTLHKLPSTLDVSDKSAGPQVSDKARPSVVPSLPRRGSDLVAALETAQAPHWKTVRHKTILPSDQPTLALLQKMSYTQAAVWIAARLAEGLDHAHRRGILHRDIKPSNILLGADGQPMLLDFNLSQDAEAAPGSMPSFGGTVVYMAPEHIYAALRRDAQLEKTIDQRADVYSLGLVLYEMLGGENPAKQGGSYAPVPELMQNLFDVRSKTTPSLKAQRPGTPWSIESILRKCLDPDPARRYQSAAQLAEDLQAFLDDRPLRHAPELSVREVAEKWMRRHPRLVSSGAVALAASLVLAVGAAGYVSVADHLQATRTQLEVAQAAAGQQAFDEHTTRALCLLNTSNDFKDLAPKGIAECEKALAIFNIAEDQDWRAQKVWQHLAPEQRLTVSESARELMLLLARARTEQQRHSPESLREALALVDRAEAIPGLKPTAAVWRERAFYHEKLGHAAQAQQAAERAAALPPTTARDHYLLATTVVRGGGTGAYAHALEHLNKAIELNPKHYWSWAQRGACHLDQGRHLQAVGDFGVCIGYWPENAWGYFNRGCAFAQAGQVNDAIHDYTATLQRDDTFVLAYLNRATAWLEQKNYAGALRDLDRALALGSDDAFVHMGRGSALDGLKRSDEAQQAYGRAFALAEGLSASKRQGLLISYAFAVCKRSPEKARAAFDEVVKLNPTQHQALYGLAMLAAEDGEFELGVNYFTRALEANPNFDDARRYRALLQARRNQFALASSDINLCIDRHPNLGDNYYAAACIAALMVDRVEPEAAQATLDQVYALLERAFALGVAKDRVDDDPDFASLRRNAAFRARLERLRW